MRGYMRLIMAKINFRDKTLFVNWTFHSFTKRDYVTTAQVFI